MKVFVDGIAFGRQRRGGGVSRVWQEYLRRLPDHGVDVRLLTPFRHTNTNLQELLRQVRGLDVVTDYFYWPSRFFESVSVRSALLKLHVDDSVDLFQSTYFSTVYDRRFPKVIMIYDMIQELIATSPPRKWESFTMEMKRRAVQNADGVVAISQNTKRDIMRHYPQVPEESISVIHCGAPSPTTNGPSFGEVVGRWKLHLAPGGYFLYVGNRDGYKNFRILLDLLNHGGDFAGHLLLCVGGENQNDFARLVAEQGYEEILLRVGYLCAEELATLYQNAIALIYPSRYEGFGLPVLEAMANRCPVICSNTSSLPEVGGDAAFYFDPERAADLQEAISRLLRSDREKVIEAGLKNVARFSWEASTRSLMSLYTSLGQHSTHG